MVCKYRVFFTILVIVFFPVFITAENKIYLNNEISWEQGIITINASMDISNTNSVLPNARYSREKIIENNLSDLLKETIFPVSVDSYFCIEDLARKDFNILTKIERLSTKGEKTISRLSPDLKTIYVQYKFNIYPYLSSIFINHSKPNIQLRILDYEPTAVFSGILIYAKEELPVHDERKKVFLQPALFPKIFDENMNTIVSVEMLNTDAIARWGIVGYSDSLDDSKFAERIGYYPLRIYAVGIFGKNYTDVIIPNSSARKILYKEENINLITKGRVLIVCNLYETD